MSLEKASRDAHRSEARGFSLSLVEQCSARPSPTLWPKKPTKSNTSQPILLAPVICRQGLLGPWDRRFGRFAEIARFDDRHFGRI